MRKASFSVPIEVLGEFTDKLAETGLENRIFGKDEDGEIQIGVFYERDETEEVDMLEEFLEELIDGMEDDDSDDEDDD